jgi:uncharacterized Fe-S cluster-containing protein
MQPSRDYLLIQKDRADRAEKRAEQMKKDAEIEKLARIASQERAQQERLRAEAEAKAKLEAEQRAEQEAQKLKRLLDFLKEKGIEPPSE